MLCVCYTPNCLASQRYPLTFQYQTEKLFSFRCSRQVRMDFCVCFKPTTQTIVKFMCFSLSRSFSLFFFSLFVCFKAFLCRLIRSVLYISIRALFETKGQIHQRHSVLYTQEILGLLVRSYTIIASKKTSFMPVNTGIINI